MKLRAAHAYPGALEAGKEQAFLSRSPATVKRGRPPRHRTAGFSVHRLQPGKDPPPVYRAEAYQPHQTHRDWRLMGRYRQQAKYSNRSGGIV